MDLIYQIAAAYPLASLAQMAFTIWMLVDVHRRRAEQYWFWVVLFFQPFGAWVYFFAVKVWDFGGLRLDGLFQRKASMDELRYRAEQMPTLANHLALAERLIPAGRHEEALPQLQAALKMEPEHCQVLYLTAVCHKEAGRLDQVPPLLEKIQARDRRWSDYAAWRLLVETKDALGDRVGALTAARELVRLAPTLQHRCLLAEHLLAEGLHAEAGELLDRALQEHQYAPGPIRRRNRHWAGVARGLQKQAASRA